MIYRSVITVVLVSCVFVIGSPTVQRRNNYYKMITINIEGKKNNIQKEYESVGKLKQHLGIDAKNELIMYDSSNNLTTFSARYHFNTLDTVYLRNILKDFKGLKRTYNVTRGEKETIDSTKVSLAFRISTPAANPERRPNQIHPGRIMWSVRSFTLFWQASIIAVILIVTFTISIVIYKLLYKTK